VPKTVGVFEFLFDGGAWPRARVGIARSSRYDGVTTITPEAVSLAEFEAQLDLLQDNIEAERRKARVISIDEAALLYRQARKRDDTFDFFECVEGNGLLAAFYRDVSRKEIDPDNNEFFSNTKINMIGQRKWHDWGLRRIRWCCYVTVADGEPGELHCSLALPGVTTQNAHGMVVGYTTDRLDRLCGRARTKDLYEMWLFRCHDEAERRASIESPSLS
jgi:hypothetical protein